MAKSNNMNTAALQAHQACHYFELETQEAAEKLKATLEDQIKAQNGQYVFPALFRVDGGRVRAKLIQAQYGWCWALCDDEGNFNRSFVGAFPQRRSTMDRKGYNETTEWAPARVIIEPLSTAGPFMVQVVRTDGGYPGCPSIHPQDPANKP